ncbi:GNAT family N-acetyltransferase [Alteromonas sp. ASW11-19]|uniref:GNAT family N-acetyltransferase n=1 Tax=Alteromonas salexigens TaxID=2982530 RepID=A0ABT2VQQ1_9ALTE|nr:GNAT family N-acetyltransferase [Alteromonas salexigens]MCU7555636.1 GNAT family N-acetyltransferase [Alteromonas salexigens]
MNQKQKVTAERYPESSAEEIVRIVGQLGDALPEQRFFTSLPWITAWLESHQLIPDLIVFRQQGEIVGFTFLGQRQQKRGLFSWRQGYLNQTGHAGPDQIWIEYNTIICIIEQQLCIDALISMLIRDRVHRLTVSMTHTPEAWQNVARLRQLTISCEPQFAARFRFDGKEIDLHLSSNTRSQIRRSIRVVEKEYGALALTPLTDPKELQQGFEEMATLHRERWGQTEQGSGFDNPAFVAHHQQLLSDYPEHAKLVRVTAGEKLLGYSLNFFWNHQVYFYCSGMNYRFTDNKIKPGYVLHYLLLQDYASKGLACYDFLAGFSRYKKSLSNELYSLYTLDILLPSAKGSVIKQLQRFKSAGARLRRWHLWKK